MRLPPYPCCSLLFTPSVRSSCFPVYNYILPHNQTFVNRHFGIFCSILDVVVIGCVAFGYLHANNEGGEKAVENVDVFGKQTQVAVDD